MISTRAAALVHPLRHVLIVSLAIGAVVAGLLALHMTIGSAAGMPASTIGSTERLLPQGDAPHVDSPITVSGQGMMAGLFPLDCDQPRALGCAVIAMTCVLFVILMGVIFLARSPSLFRRLVASGRVVLQSISETRNHVYLPSLAVLSISRT